LPTHTIFTTPVTALDVSLYSNPRTPRSEPREAIYDVASPDDCVPSSLDASLQSPMREYLMGLRQQQQQQQQQNWNQLKRGSDASECNYDNVVRGAPFLSLCTSPDSSPGTREFREPIYDRAEDVDVSPRAAEMDCRGKLTRDGEDESEDEAAVGSALVDGGEVQAADTSCDADLSLLALGGMGIQLEDEDRLAPEPPPRPSLSGSAAGGEGFYMEPTPLSSKV
jgi:hypothetical protein